MNKIKLIIFGALITLFGSTSDLNAVIDNNGAAFLLNPVGARAIALGHSYRAAGKDGFSLLWNPAGLAHIRASQFNIYQTTLLSALTQQYIGYTHRFFDVWSLGVGYSSFGVDNLIEANSSGIRSGNTFGFRGNSFNIGSGLKLGFFAKELNDISIGLSYHVWPRFFIQGELTISNDGAYTYSLSSEWTLLSSPFAILDLRGGIHQKRGFSLGKIGMTAGVGLKLWMLSLDYAYDIAPLELLDNNHLFSFSYDL